VRLSHATAKGKGVSASSETGSLLDRTDQEIARPFASSPPAPEATSQLPFPTVTGPQNRNVPSPSTLAISGECSSSNVKRNSHMSSASPASHPSRSQSATPDAVRVPSDRTDPFMSSTDTRSPVHAMTIQDIPPSLIVQVATLARNGTLVEYLLQQGCTDAAEALSRISFKMSSSGTEKIKARDMNPALQQMLSQPRSTPSNDGAGAEADVRPSMLPDEAKLEEGARDLLPSLAENIAGSSGDPYNTTVFVGGLSSLIPEDTLRSFFAPFGDIHYVCVKTLGCAGNISSRRR
jgi:hypothetical protein